MDHSRDTQRPRAPRSVRLATAAALLALAGLAFTPLAGAIQYQVPPPILSPTHPNPATWYSDSDPEFSWSFAEEPGLEGNLSLPGFAVAVDVDGDYAYVGQESGGTGQEGLTVADVSQPGTMSILGSAPTSETIRRVVSDGSYVYAAVDTSGAVVFDVSDKANPVVAGSFPTTSWANGIDVDGDRAYVAASSDGLVALDVADPTAPAILDLVPAGSARAVEVHGDHAYVAAAAAGLVIVDVSEPGTLTVAGSLDTPSSAMDVTVEGDYAYIADGASGGVVVASILDPSNPTTAAIVPLPGDQTSSVAVAGDRLYVGWGNNGLRVFDISDPTDPREVASLATGYPYDLAIDGPTLFAVDGRLKTFRVWEPSEPLLRGTLDTSGYAQDVEPHATYAYIADSNTVDAAYVQDPENPVYVSSGSGLGYRLAKRGDYVYSAGASDGLNIFDITLPGSPSVVGSYDTTGVARGVDAAGDYAYVADDTNGLVVVDISTPGTATLAGSATTTDTAEGVAVRGDYAYVAVDADGLAIFDISDPRTPTLVGQEDPGSGAANDVKVAGDYAFLAFVGGNLQVVDISDPSAPFTAGGAAITGSVQSLDIAGDYAYLACNDSTVGGYFVVVDISDPTNPSELWAVPMADDTLGVRAAGRTAYLADGAAGMEIFSLDWPAGTSWDMAFETAPSVPASPTTRTLEASYSSLADGEWWFGVRVQSGSGEWGPVRTRPVRIDKTSPSTTDDAPTGWRKSDVVVTLDATDTPFGAATKSAGVAGTLYSLDGSAEVTYTAPITMSAEGVHTIDYRSGDWAMNIEGVNTATVRIDKTKPVTTTDADTTHEGAAEVTLSATDSGGSGVDATYYSVDNGPVKTYSAPFDVEGLGSHTLEFFSEDVAGNQEASKKVTFDIVSGGTTYVNVEGATRYETAIAASQKAFPRGAGMVIIATGENWPDALGGAALAGAWDAPILLTPGAGLPGSVASEITRLGAADAIILGGPGAVSAAVGNQLLAQLGAGHVFRLGGATRYDTADLVAQAVARRLGTAYDGTAFVTTGLNFPDALAGSPLAAAGPWPIFLSPATGPTAATRQVVADIGVKQLIILGGEGVVTPATMAALEAQYGAGNVTRLAGPTRYETAWEVASFGVDEAGLAWDGVAIATGENFPDALSGGALQGQSGSVMALTLTAQLPPVVSAGLAGERDFIEQVRFLGGTGAVSQNVRDQVAGILK